MLFTAYRTFIVMARKIAIALRGLQSIVVDDTCAGISPRPAHYSVSDSTRRYRSRLQSLRVHAVSGQANESLVHESWPKYDGDDAIAVPVDS
ncbi:hypothetical protein GQ600_25939 [Phytophthora cactorum]|nr:hypothetical protein GQ600_25939 [Phytophthora cactorum]